MLFIDGGDVLIILELPADKFIHFHDLYPTSSLLQSLCLWNYYIVLRKNIIEAETCSKEGMTTACTFSYYQI